MDTVKNYYDSDALRKAIVEDLMIKSYGRGAPMDSHLEKSDKNDFFRKFFSNHDQLEFYSDEALLRLANFNFNRANAELNLKKEALCSFILALGLNDEALIEEMIADLKDLMKDRKI